LLTEGGQVDGGELLQNRSPVRSGILQKLAAPVLPMLLYVPDNL
jgi:hypothetical protein